MARMSVGFLFSPFAEVLLIRKNRPQWQAGLLNGIGGKCESGESPFDCMNREAKEEADIEVEWKMFASIKYSGESHHTDAEIFFFKSFVNSYTFVSATTLTDEELVRVPCKEIGILGYETIPNLNWLIPMAIASHSGRDYGIHIIEAREPPMPFWLNK